MMNFIIHYFNNLSLFFKSNNIEKFINIHFLNKLWKPQQKKEMQELREHKQI